MSLEITRGDDELINFVVRDPDGVGAVASDSSTWPLVDLTGCELWFYVKASAADEDVDALIAKGPLDIVIAPDQTADKGEASVAIAAADTASIARSYLGRNLRYEVQLKDGASKISTVAVGVIVITADIIRATT